MRAIHGLGLAVAMLLATGLQAQEPGEGTPAENPRPAVDGKSLFRQAYELTQEAETREDFSKIIALCEQGLAVEPSEKEQDYGKRLAAWAYNKRGEAYVEGDPPNEEAALADFEQAVAYDSSNYRYFHNRGVSYGQHGELEKALADFNRCIRLNNRHAKAHFNRGEVLFALGQVDDAVRAYTAAIRLNDDDPDAYNARGFAYYEQGNYTNAFTDFNRAIRLDGDHHQALTNRGTAYADRGYFSRAIRDYQAAIAANDTYTPAYVGAAWFRATCPVEQWRRADLALRSANKAIELEGKTWRHLDVLAAAQARDGQFEDAVKTQQESIALAEEAGLPSEQIDLLKNRLARYESGKPWADVAPGTAQPE